MDRSLNREIIPLLKKILWRDLIIKFSKNLALDVFIYFLEFNLQENIILKNLPASRTHSHPQVKKPDSCQYLQTAQYRTSCKQGVKLVLDSWYRAEDWRGTGIVQPQSWDQVLANNRLWSNARTETVHISVLAWYLFPVPRHYRWTTSSQIIFRSRAVGRPCSCQYHASCKQGAMPVLDSWYRVEGWGGTGIVQVKSRDQVSAKNRLLCNASTEPVQISVQAWYRCPVARQYRWSTSNKVTFQSRAGGRPCLCQHQASCKQGAKLVLASWYWAEGWRGTGIVQPQFRNQVSAKNRLLCNASTEPVLTCEFICCKQIDITISQRNGLAICAIQLSIGINRCHL